MPDARDVCPGGTLGDVNTDGFVNPGDIAAFTAVLFDPMAASADEFCAADVNQVSSMDGSDNQGFVGFILTP